MQSHGPFPQLPHWLRSSLSHPVPRGLGGFSRALALSLSGSSLILSASARRHLATSASSSSAAQAPEKASLLERFPLKAALTAGTLALAGDTLAQVNERRRQGPPGDAGVGGGTGPEAGATSSCGKEKQATTSPLAQHDLVRALRMASYGFLLYGPFSQLWYQVLEKHLPGAAAKNLTLKVIANQVVLGPCVLLVVFAWNFAWMGRARDIPGKYRRDFFPALVDGWKFWIPASVLNFGLVPLQFRVAYMSTCAIFWNFYLSSSVGKDIPKVVAP